MLDGYIELLDNSFRSQYNSPNKKEYNMKTRRLRRAASNIIPKKSDTESVKKTATIRVEVLLKEYAELQRRAEELKAGMDTTFKAIDIAMKENELDSIEYAGWNAARVDVKTNSKNTTDPMKLFDLLEDNNDLESFWGAVTVSSTKVKAVVTGKEYASITETIPGHVTGQKLKLTPTKKTVTSK